jgi:hypothetical protein
LYFNEKVDRLYVTTAKPEHLQAFDISKGDDTLRVGAKKCTCGDDEHCGDLQ